MDILLLNNSNININFIITGFLSINFPGFKAVVIVIPINLRTITETLIIVVEGQMTEYQG